MTRRRTFWLIFNFIVLIGAAAIAWAVLGTRDADFQVAGPRTRSIRSNFAALDATIDAADFHDCKTVQAALDRLAVKLRGQDKALLVIVERRALLDEGVSLDVPDPPRQYPKASTPMTVKQFLRLTFHQNTTQEVGFLVDRHYVVATSMKRVEEERARYLASVSFVERVKSTWKDMTGEIEEDPPEVLYF